MITVELDIFSGRPNPQWQLSKRQTAELVDRVMAHPSLLLPFEAETGGLGYRGFIITVAKAGEENAWTKAKLPKLTRIGGMRMGNKATAAAHWLLHTSTGMRSTVHPDVLQVTASTIQAASAGVEERYDEHIAAPLAAFTACSNSYITSSTDFSFWNDSSMRNNNCYNYASALKTNTFAQPGRGSGSIFTQLTCSDIGAASQRDGWKTTCQSGPNLNTCLVIAPGQDYHWYRLCQNGFWCHKPGQTAARNYDNSGNLITNPETCDRGIYTIFCGYYRGIQSSLRIN